MRAITARIAALLTAAGALSISTAFANVPDKPSASRQLAALLAAADEEDLRLMPQNAILRGDMRFAGEFGDYISDAWVRRGEANARRQLQRARRIDRAALSPPERIAYDSLRYQAELVVRSHTRGAARMRQAMPLDHVFGFHVTFAQMASGEGAAPFKSVADYEHGLSRLAGYVTWLDRVIPAMRRGIRAGQTQARVVTEKMIGQIEAQLAQPADQSPYLQPLRNFPAEIPQSEQSRLRAAYESAFANRVRPALGRLLDFLRAEYLPASRTGVPGLAALPGGAGLYAQVLEEHVTARLDAADVHRIGLMEVARIRAEMDQVRARLGIGGTLQFLFDHLQDDPTQKFDNREALLARFREIQARVNARVETLFAQLPKARLEIRAVPPEQESSAGGAYYMISTPDGTRPGVFFVNTSDIGTRTAPRLTALFLHEGMPGHHLQGSLAQEDERLPAMLRFAWNAGFGEGWALYAEWLGYEMGLYEDPYQRFGALDMEIIRAARLVVDTGLHAMGWTRAQAIAYMAENSSLDRGAIEQEVDRYIVWPGQAVAYKVGELFIRRLRQNAAQRLGARFDVREFHRQVLDTGALPLAVLERKIDGWIATTLNP